MPSARFSGFSLALGTKSISSIVFVFDVPPLIWVQIKPAWFIRGFQLLPKRNQGPASSEFPPEYDTASTQTRRLCSWLSD